MIMNAKARREPGPDHPITVTPNPAHIVVKVGDGVKEEAK